MVDLPEPIVSVRYDGRGGRTAGELTEAPGVDYTMQLGADDAPLTPIRWRNVEGGVEVVDLAASSMQGELTAVGCVL